MMSDSVGKIVSVRVMYLYDRLKQGAVVLCCMRTVSMYIHVW